MKTFKWVVGVVGSLVLVGGALFLADKLGLLHVTRTIVGDLQVLTYAPQGKDIPISTDGFTVMFNKAVVPLTTLDSGRDKAVALKITPRVEGKFFWLGTHGFIFRPLQPLEAATTYHVEMPAGLVSIDGYRLSKPLQWEFSTVAPKILNWSPSDNQTLLPKSASFFLRFNIAMNTSDVEKKLAVTDAATGQMILAKRAYVWGDDGHTLRVQFHDDLPWESQFKVTLPEGVRTKTGDVGTAEPVTVTYATPGKEMKVEKVSTYDINTFDETLFTPDKELLITAGSGVCYTFSQSVDKKSFEKAFHAEPAKDDKQAAKTPKPYYYFGARETFQTLGADGKLSEMEGYKQGCAAFLDDYDRAYRFSIDPKKIVSLSGAPLESGGDNYTARTNHASPEMHSLLTKNILSHKGSLKIPYRGMNLKSATVRIYRWNKDRYDETIKNDSLILDQNQQDNPKPPVSGTLGSSRVSLPVDATTLQTTLTVDQKTMPADLSQEIPLEMKRDESTRFLIDLAALPNAVSTVSQDGRIVPGIYLLEVTGHPAIDVKTKKGKDKAEANIIPKSVYSVIQVTPVGIALKRESDHILVWTTDIESGAPLSGVPVNITLQKWNSSAGVNEKQGEGNVITNEQGVGILNLASTDELHACAEVTQPGSESYSCEAIHMISPYRWGMKPGQHHFAYLYTDRPIYRPGQTVYFSSFVREVREGRYFMMPPGTPVQVTVTDSDGQEVFKNDQATLGVGGVVSGEFKLKDEDDVPRGEYHLVMKVDQQQFSKIFVVSSYRKPSFKVDLKTDSPEIVSGNEMKVDVTGSYFFGAPMRKAKATWSIMTSTYLFTPEGFEEYSFLDSDLLYKKVNEEGDESYAGDYEYSTVASSSDFSSAEGSDQYDDPRSIASSKHGGDFFHDPDNKKISLIPEALDEKGVLQIRYKPNLKKYATSQTMTVETNVQDPSNQEVSGAEDVIVHKADFYLGVKPDKWVYGDKETAHVKVVSLDTKGKPAPRTPFKVDVVRREYKYIERRTANGYWSIVFEPEDKKLTTLSGKTAANAEDEVTYALPQGGTYRFIVKGEDGHGNAIQSAVDVYAWGEGYVPWRLDKPETVELVPDKTSYKVGDTAKILVKSLVPVTKALMTLERGHVLEYKVIDLGGNASHIEIPITEGMIPNLYLDVVAHVGRAGDRPPLLYYGETELHIAPESKRLSIAITPDRTGQGENPPIYRPGDTVKVHVKATDPSGKGLKAHVIVSVADESVLRLLGYQLPDLVKKFYYLRPNSVVTASSLFSLKAGDSGTGGSKKRRIFKDTAHFEAHLTTNDQGDADFSFKLPDDLTTWVIEALGISESKTTQDFETERRQAMPLRPSGQTALGSDLILTDNTFVGGNRGKIMSTLPLVLRSALPRFAVWGDEMRGKVIVNNRNTQAAEGKLTVSVTGDAGLKGNQPQQVIDLQIPANSEKSFPVDIDVTSAASGRLTFSADAKDKSGETLDSFEISLPVKDRFAPEVVATSGTTQTEEKEKLDIPSDTVSEKGGIELSLKPSIAFAAAPSLRSLIYFPWGCSEQKSASLLALLMARDMTARFGEAYFDTLAPIDPEVIKKTKGLDAKKELLDDQINKIIDELYTKYQDPSTGGMRYWPESQAPSYFASAQVLAAMDKAKEQGFEVNDTDRENLKKYVRTEIMREDHPLDWDSKAYGLWALTLDHVWEMDLAADTLIKGSGDMSVSGLSYLLMALKDGNAGVDATLVSGRLMSFAKQDPRHVSWTETPFYWSSGEKNTSLAALALLTDNPDDPTVPRALAFLLNRKKAHLCDCTQDNLYVSWLVTEYSKHANEDKTDYKATVTAATKTIAEASFKKENLLDVKTAKVAMKDLMDLKMPVDLAFAKSGDGTLYYDMLIKYYLPPEKTPTREEGLIISREYYALDDVKEENPLTAFKVGENYRGHIIVVAPHEMNYTIIQDLLPAGFEPIDMTLATSSRAAEVESQTTATGNQLPPAEFSSDWDEGESRYPYDDVVTTQDYGMNYAFLHHEIRDDAVVWSDETIPAGVYHIRYPVRATTSGTYLMPGATAFEFYEPEIFGRSRARTIKITE